MFKTSDECGLELVAHTFVVGKDGHGDFMGTADFLPVSAARASFGKEDKTGENEKADIKLMKFLADNRHVSVFEHNYATFLIECPLFVRSHIMRHESFQYDGDMHFNEMSRRYTSDDIGFWIPDKWRKQSKSNKQASTDDEVESAYELSREYNEACHRALESYDLMLEAGLCREQARAVLPPSLLTRFYMTGNLRSWWSFLSSRQKEDTQYETRVVADRIADKLRTLWPESMNALLGDE